MGSFIKYSGVGFLFLIVLFALGPKPDFPMYGLEPMHLKIQLKDLDSYIANKEAAIEDIKPDNESRIVWYQDSIHQSEYSLVYLHGFSSSQGEGDPIHRDFARRYGLNLYLPRIEDHGRSSDNSFKNLTPKALIESAKEAIAIGATIGKKVILMSCSTGGTYSLMLGPEDDRVHSLIMYSPNVELTDPNAKLVTYPWGKQILRTVMGGDYNRISYTKSAQQYWNSVYHIDGIIAVQGLLDDGMRSELFKNLKKPTFVGAYYKDENHQDNVVSVAAMNEMINSLGTASNQKILRKFPEAGRHVFTSSVMVDEFEEVKRSTFEFAENTIGLIPR